MDETDPQTEDTQVATMPSGPAQAPSAPPPWEEVADHFKQAFPLLDQEKVRNQYEQSRTLAESRAYHASPEAQAEEQGNYWMRSIDPMQSIKSSLENVTYKDARERFDAGKASGGDFDIIARHEQRQEADAKRGLAANVGGAIASVPGAALKWTLGGGLPRFVVEQTIEGATAKAAEGPNNGQFYEPHNLLPAAGMAGAQALVLGSLGKWTSGIKNAGARFAASVGLGVAEWEAVKTAGAGLDEVLPEAWKTRTEYGILGHLAQGKFGAALQDAVVEPLTVAAFIGIGGNKYHPKELAEGIGASLGQSKKAGASPDEAAANLRQSMQQKAFDILGLGPNPTPEEVASAYRTQAKKTHPDMGGSKEEFGRTQWAWEYLNAQARKNAPQEPPQPPPGRPQPPPEAPVPPQAQQATEGVQQAPGELASPPVRGQAPEVSQRPGVIPMAGEGQRQLSAPPVVTPEQAKARFDELTALRKVNEAADKATDPAIHQEISDILKEHPEFRETSVLAKPRKVAPEPVEGEQPVDQRTAALEARITQGKKDGVDTSKLEWMLSKIRPKLSPLERMRAKQIKAPAVEGAQYAGEEGVAKIPVGTEREQELARREEILTGPHQMSDKHIEAGLTPAESYVHDKMIGEGVNAPELAKDPRLPTMNSHQSVRAAQRRASDKLGETYQVTDPDTGEVTTKVKTANQLQLERRLEQSKIGKGGEPISAEEVTDKEIEDHMAKVAAKGHVISEAQAHKELAMAHSDEAGKEQAFTNKWSKFAERLAKDARYSKLSPAELAGLNDRIGRALSEGRVPPKDVGLAFTDPEKAFTKRASKQTTLRSKADEQLRADIAQRDEFSPEVKVISPRLAPEEHADAVQNVKRAGYPESEAPFIVGQVEEEVAAEARVAGPSGQGSEPSSQTGQGPPSGPVTQPTGGAGPVATAPTTGNGNTGPAGQPGGNGRSLADHVKDVATEFLHDDGAAVNLQTLKEKMQWVASAAHFTGQAVRRLAGQMFPDTTELNRVVGEKMAQWAHAEYHAIEQGEWYGDEVVGYKEGSRGSVRLGAVITEMRLEHMKAYYAAEATRTSNEAYAARQRAVQATNPMDRAKALAEAADFARQATAAMNARLGVNSVVGMFGSPFQTRQEYLNAKQSPVVQQQLKDWSRKLSPVLDDNYRETQGLGPLDPIDAKTQMPGLTVNLFALEEGNKPSSTMASQGNPKNLRMKKNPFATKAEGSAEAYELDAHKIIQNSFKKGTPVAARAVFYRTATDMRVGEFAPRGTKAEGKIEFIDAKPPVGTQDAGAKDTSFFIDSKASGELRTLLDIDKHGSFTNIAAVMSQVPTIGALSSFVEVATHSVNLGTALYAPGMLRTFKGAVDIAKTEWQQFFHNHEFMKEVMELAEIGATKSRGAETGTIGSGLRKLSNALIDRELPPEHFDKFWDPTYHSGKIIHHFDKLMRVSLSHAFDRIAAQDPSLKTETSKRDFINQWLGMYNRKAQNQVVAWLRASGFGPFATAATGQTIGAIRNVIGSPRISGLKAADQLKLRVGYLAKVVGTMLGGVLMYNLARWGRIDGDDDTPFGCIKLDPGPDGKHRSFDVMRFTGVTRGLRSIGGLAVYEGLRKGHSAGRIADDAILDIAHSIAHPFTGPLTQFGYTALTGKDTYGRQIAPKVSTAKTPAGIAKAAQTGKPAPGSSQMALNLKAAAESVNQPYAALFGNRKNDVTAEETISKIAGPFGVKYRDIKKKR